jgi:hypothetical protein
MFAHPSVVRYVLRTEVAEHQEPTAKALMVLPFLVFSCSQRDFDSVAEGQKLLRRDAEWVDLATAGKDIARWQVRLYARDGRAHAAGTERHADDAASSRNITLAL